MKLISAKYIFDGQQLLTNHALLIENNQLKQIIPISTNLTTKLHYIGDGILSHGLIDLQINGCDGVLFNDNPTINTLEIMYQCCKRFATSHFLPTLITDTPHKILTALDTLKQWFSLYKNTRGVIGIHLEGPFISKDKPGIHPQNLIIKPTDSLLQKIIAYKEFFPIKMTIAPEVFSVKQINLLYNAGVILSIGHSNATYEKAYSAINQGISVATHTFNALSNLSARNPNAVGAVLNTNIFAGIIVDLVHVDKVVVEILYKLKFPHMFLVTDAVTPMGSSIKEFYLGGKKLSIINGKCIDENNTIGGSILNMPQAVENCINYCNINLIHALQMATTIPAKIMQQNQLGSLYKNMSIDNLIYLSMNPITNSSHLLK